MKILSLNTWGARAGEELLLDFIEKRSKGVDVFCFQEIWNVVDEDSKNVYNLLQGAIVGGTVLEGIIDNIYSRIQSTLPNYKAFFRPHYGKHYGLAMFVREGLSLAEEGDVFVFKDRNFIPTGDVGNHARNIQYATIETPSGKRTIINFHGLWNGRGKTDTEDRLLQSENIIKFLGTLNHPFILCGDFNLLPDTESLKKFEKFGLKNLIKDYGVASTRTSLYKKENKYADYAFTSPNIKVSDFRVLPDEVSDHSPLLLEFK